MKQCKKCNIFQPIDKFDIIPKHFPFLCTKCYIEEYGENYKEMFKFKSRKKYGGEIEVYRQKVRELTEINKVKIFNIEKRNFFTHHIDHKISIQYGYENSIPAEHIADPSNLHILEKMDNILKKDKNIIDEGNKWILTS